MDREKAKHSSFAKVIALLLLCLPLSLTGGELYKWVDDEGNVQFGNTIPPEYIKNKHSTLNKKGREIESKDSIKIEQERAHAKMLKEQEEKRKQVEEDRIRKEQVAYDRLLLESYLTEKDLLDMRDRQLVTIDGIITLTESNISKLNAKLAKLNAEITESKLDDTTKNKINNEISNTNRQVTEFLQFITSRRAEQDRIKANFARDLERLRELFAAKK